GKVLKTIPDLADKYFMEITGPKAVMAGRIPPSVPMGRSSSSGDGFGVANLPPKAIPDSVTPDAKDSGYRLLFGEISLDLHFSLYERYSQSVVRQTADGYIELRNTVERAYKADYSFDFSFLAKLDQTALKLGGFDIGVLGEFVSAASDLTTLSEKDLKEFTEAASNLFDEMEKAVGGDAGMFAGMFDGAEALLKNSLTGFMRKVRDDLESFKAVSSSAGNATGADSPKLPSIDFQKLRRETMGNFDDGLFDYLQKLLKESRERIAEEQMLLLDALPFFNKPGEDEEPPFAR
ncbi:MAG: hypothetical protein V3S46_05130, partial [Nitrospinota bacterium]